MSDLTIIFISATCLSILAIMIYVYKSRTKSKQQANRQALDSQRTVAEQHQAQHSLGVKSNATQVDARRKPDTIASSENDDHPAEPLPPNAPPLKAQPAKLDTFAEDILIAGDHDASQLDATIMLVDDEVTTIEVLQALLEDVGYRHFMTTSQSEQAIELIESSPPDIVLTDLNMPGVTGFDILKAMREHVRLQHIPVIMLTSADDAKTKLQALQLGAADFLAKPVDPSELALRLRNTLAAKAYQDRLAHYDALTGLPNRRMLMSRLDRALQHAVRHTKQGAVLHISLDRVKQMNETLGRHAGDALLKTVAQRLEQALQARLAHRDRRDAPPLLARFGGAEFIVLLPETDGPMSIDQLVHHILATLGESFHMNNRDLVVTACIGIAMFPANGNDIETLLKHVDMATNHTKQKGSNTYAFYSNDMNAKMLARIIHEA